MRLNTVIIGEILMFMSLLRNEQMTVGASSSKVIHAYCTSYGWNDNSPPSAQIAYPGLHKLATEGSGTYNDPITFATDKDEIPIGTRVYVSYLRKYFIMEDDCTECDHNWQQGRKYHIDLWMGPQHYTDNLSSCEDYITKNNCELILNPPKNLPVETTPLVNPNTGQCTAKLF